MPLFEFRCKKCNQVFEEFTFSSNVKIEEIVCPSCGEKDSEKMMSAFCSAGSSSNSGSSDIPTAPCGRAGFS